MANSLRCDMCGKPLKSKRFQIQYFLRPERSMTVGPDCFKKEKEAQEARKLQLSPEQLAAKRAEVARKCAAIGI